LKRKVACPRAILDTVRAQNKCGGHKINVGYRINVGHRINVGYRINVGHRKNVGY
jgi:hypothetical protein